MSKIILEGRKAEDYILSISRDNVKINQLKETVNKLLSEKYSFVSSFEYFNGTSTLYEFSGDESELLKENKALKLEVLKLKNRNLIQRIFRKYE